MTLPIAPFAAALVCLASFSAAASGIVLTAEEKGDSGAGPVTIQSEGELLRLDLARGGAMIWRGDREVLWHVDAKERGYTEITKNGMQAMTAQMGAAMAQMRQQMASMPEAQRKQIEQMLAQSGGVAGMPGAPRQVTYRKIASGKKVGAWRCDDWEKLVDGKRTQELCLAKLGDLGLKRADLKPMQDMAAFAREIAGPMVRNIASTELDPDALAKAAGQDVYPVRVVTLSDAGGHEFVLKSVERRTVAPATFEIPPGYAKRDMGMPDGRRAR
jgi:hypothetical protein